MLSVASLSKLLAEGLVGGSGDQYELSVFAGGLSGAFGADFLTVEALRGLVMPLLCTRVTFTVACTGALMVEMEPSRADRRRDILVFATGVMAYNSESLGIYNGVSQGFVWRKC
jgi:hypothetical protein